MNRRIYTEKDPFNEENTLKCVLDKDDYGWMKILKVNNVRCPQIIYTTPKLEYPMDKWGNLTFPVSIQIEVYEKYDGTNITSFIYEDHKHNRFISYKTRMRPFVYDSERFGSFYKMWNKMLEKYPQIPDVVKKNYKNLSFEMFGYKNPYIIDYDIALDIRLLFGVGKNAEITSPSHLYTGGVPIADTVAIINPESNLFKKYNEIRMFLEKKLVIKNNEIKANVIPKDGEYFIENYNHNIKGMEGVVWYFQKLDSTFKMIKCKPPSIEQIHWTSEISVNGIFTTCLNVLEQGYDQLTYENILPFLKEEWNDQEIKRFKEKTLKIISKINEGQKFEENVYKDYIDNKLDFINDKNRTMRWFASHYDKHQTNHIFNILNKQLYGKK